MLHMQVGQTIRLKGISRHGKNRIHEAKGDTWRISEIRREVAFKTTAPGPFILTEVFFRFPETDPSYPHIKMLYCDDNSTGSCSAWRVEELINEAR